MCHTDASWGDHPTHSALLPFLPFLQGGLASAKRLGFAVQFAVSDLNTYACLLVKETQWHLETWQNELRAGQIWSPVLCACRATKILWQ